MPGTILPAPVITLLGRDQEIAVLQQSVRHPATRLLTITGPGGVGKTSMALHLAYKVKGFYPDGVYFVSLAPITDPILIIPTIAQALELSESPNRLLIDVLKDSLRDKQMLLLLDNFEQIVSAAPILSELLDAAAGLQMLITSREALRLRGEREFPLSPLALSDPSTIDQTAPGIALFVERVQAIQPNFQLTEENAPVIREICARLDGLPLAIELAAARIKLLPPEAMLEKLQDSALQLLTSGARDLPARQQTLHNAIQWSYDLLEREEQHAFRWCAVFVSGSTLEAAQAVIGISVSLDVIDSLLGKSLLRQTELEGAPRLAMLETIREFGLEQLQREAELEEARRAHALWYTSFAGEAEPHLLTADQKAWLQQLELEVDNLRAAFRWAIETGDETLTLRLAGSLGQFWFASGRWTEGRRSLEEALAQTGNAQPDPVLLARVLFNAGFLARYQADFARARDLCEQSLALFRTLGDKQGVVVALAELSRISNSQHDPAARRDFYAEAAALIESLPDSVEKALAYKNILVSVLFSTDPITDETLRHLEAFEGILRTLNFRSDLALAISQHALLAMLEGDNTLAASLMDEAMQLVDEFSDEHRKIRIEAVQAFLDLHLGDFAAARHRLVANIQSAHKRMDSSLSVVLPMLAIVLLEQGMAEWSAKVLGLDVNIVGIEQNHPDRAILQRSPLTQGFREKLLAQLGEEAFEKNLLAGKQLTLDDLLAIPHPAAGVQTSPNSLTSRELEVLHLLAEELSNPQIAERLVVSRRTVDAHLRSIYDKLGVKSRDAALRVGRERGLLKTNAQD